MKARIIIFSIALLLLNSCIVKSLFPFYTQDTIYFEKKFIGTWEDTENGKWNVHTFQEFFLKEMKENENKSPGEFNESDNEMYNKYKNGYMVYFEKDSTKTSFLAMPFKINNQLFLDFTPYQDKESDELDNNLYQMHLIGMHTLAKFDITTANEVSIKWLSSRKLVQLLDENKIKIKHEQVGIMETTLLTASSEELEKFIKKYIASKDDTKWEGGENQIIVNLKKQDG